MLARTLNTVFLAGVLSFSACTNTSNEPAAEQQLWEEIMVVHDEIMPWMGELNSIARGVKDKIASGELTEAALSEWQASLGTLESADRAMWKWMNELQQIDKLRQDKSHQEIMDYLAAEKAAIEEVKNLMASSMASGKLLLESATSTENPEQ